MSYFIPTLPILLRPKAIAARRSIRAAFSSYQQVVRWGVLASFAMMFAGAIFWGAKTLIEQLHAHLDVAFIPASVPLGLFLLFIMVMLLLSSGVSAVGALFHARDLDLLLASPLHRRAFYLGKLLEVLLSSSWLVIVFGIPAVLGFGAGYKAPASYYLLLPVVLIPYFLTPAALAVVVATLFSSALPSTRTRELFGIITIVTFFGLFLLFRLIVPDDANWQDINTMLHIISAMLTPNAPWTPSYWASAALGEWLEPTGRPFGLYLLLLYAAALASTSLAYCVLRVFHFPAYSNSRTQRLGTHVFSSRMPFFIRILPASGPTKTLVTKEYRVFSRDITQALQLLLLLGLCVIYLYNLRILNAVQVLGSSQSWWEGFLAITNICLGAFITSAMCTRFVFPSLSLEGQSLWILQTSPLSLAQILRAKFLAWYFPVAIVASVVFSAGALAINASPMVVVGNIVMSWLIAYGIVGLAIGLGAHFANFDWEHPSQLAASFGSLVFMLLSVLSIFINMLPSLLLLFLHSEHISAQLSEGKWITAALCALMLIGFFNFSTTRWALSLGEQSLRQRFS
jgi:ABC-2 type transport system permease protein